MTRLTNENGRVAARNGNRDVIRRRNADTDGAIPDNLAPILDRLGLDRSNWLKTVREFGRMFKQAARRVCSLARAAPGCSRRWFKGKRAAHVAFD